MNTIVTAAVFVLAAALLPLLWVYELKRALCWARLRRKAYRRHLQGARRDEKRALDLYAEELDARKRSDRYALEACRIITEQASQIRQLRDEVQKDHHALLEACRYLEKANEELYERREALLVQELAGKPPTWGDTGGSS